MTPDLLSVLARIEKEARRALEGMADGRIPKGTSALTNVLHLSGDALAEAHESGRMEYSAESVRLP